HDVQADAQPDPPRVGRLLRPRLAEREHGGRRCGRTRPSRDLRRGVAGGGARPTGAEAPRGPRPSDGGDPRLPRHAQPAWPRTTTPELSRASDALRVAPERDRRRARHAGERLFEAWSAVRGQDPGREVRAADTRRTGLWRLADQGRRWGVHGNRSLRRTVVRYRRKVGLPDPCCAIDVA